MADIVITSIGPRKFHVQIREDDLATSQALRCPKALSTNCSFPKRALTGRYGSLSFFSWSESLPRRSCPRSRWTLFPATFLSTREFAQKALAAHLAAPRRKNRLNDNSTMHRS